MNTMMMEQQAPAEAVAHAVLRVVADMPGQMGRLRVARVVGGLAVSGPDDETVARLAGYALEGGWPVRRAVDLVDALIDAGLLARTVGPRPVLVLTRAGYMALEALEGSREFEGDASGALHTIRACE